jgi:hypothetical protein
MERSKKGQDNAAPSFSPCCARARLPTCVKTGRAVHAWPTYLKTGAVAFGDTSERAWEILFTIHLLSGRSIHRSTLLVVNPREASTLCRKHSIIA